MRASGSGSAGTSGRVETKQQAEATAQQVQELSSRVRQQEAENAAYRLQAQAATNTLRTLVIISLKTSCQI